jgi:hypothetical protein
MLLITTAVYFDGVVISSTVSFLPKSDGLTVENKICTF